MELPTRIHEGQGESRAVPRSRANGAHPLGGRLGGDWFSLKAGVFSPVRAVSLAIPMHFDKQLCRVSWGGGICVEQEMFVLGQVLGRGLLGCPGTVQQLPL